MVAYLMQASLSFVDAVWISHLVWLGPV